MQLTNNTTNHAEPLGEPPAADDYHSFETWEQAKEWLEATAKNGMTSEDK
jgi:hypothetical protein